jgi:hypothetical protein
LLSGLGHGRTRRCATWCEPARLQPHSDQGTAAPWRISVAPREDLCGPEKLDSSMSTLVNDRAV